MKNIRLVARKKKRVLVQVAFPDPAGGLHGHLVHRKVHGENHGCSNDQEDHGGDVDGNGETHLSCPATNSLVNKHRNYNSIENGEHGGLGEVTIPM